jgi:hypothetical protein
VAVSPKQLAWLKSGNAHRTHGGASRKNGELPEYRIWLMMKRRCDLPTGKKYARYGGRGIRVCDRWLGENGFANFLVDMGLRSSPDLSLDRIDNDGNYEPGNCRWATQLVQQNNRSNNRTRRNRQWQLVG